RSNKLKLNHPLNVLKDIVFHTLFVAEQFVSLNPYHLNNIESDQYILFHDLLINDQKIPALDDQITAHQILADKNHRQLRSTLKYFPHAHLPIQLIFDVLDE